MKPERPSPRPPCASLRNRQDRPGRVRPRAGAHDIELVSTGGTARALREAGLTVRDISDLTGFPEMLDGRVKTLHPKVHGGILHIRANKEHVAAVKEHGIEPIDMVAVNLYAFEKTANKPGVAFSEIIENIDIGGPSMVRSAAKNFEDVAIVTSVADYAPVAEELAANAGSLTRETRWRLSKAAFAVTAAYDAGIATTLESIAAPLRTASLRSSTRRGCRRPSRVIHPLKTVPALRREPAPEGRAVCGWKRGGVASAKQLQGKYLSYNNLVDFGRLLATGGRVRRGRGCCGRDYQAHQPVRRGDRRDRS